jgi:hypothetical protein
MIINRRPDTPEHQVTTPTMKRVKTPTAKAAAAIIERCVTPFPMYVSQLNAHADLRRNVNVVLRWMVSNTSASNQAQTMLLPPSRNLSISKRCKFRSYFLKLYVDPTFSAKSVRGNAGKARSTPKGRSSNVKPKVATAPASG